MLVNIKMNLRILSSLHIVIAQVIEIMLRSQYLVVAISNNTRGIVSSIYDMLRVILSWNYVQLHGESSHVSNSLSHETSNGMSQDYVCVTWEYQSAL